MELLNKTGDGLLRSKVHDRRYINSCADVLAQAEWNVQHVYSLIIQFLYSSSCSLGNVAQGHFSTQSLSLFVKVVRGQNILHCEKYVCTFLWALACKYNRVFPNFASRWTSSWAFTDCFETGRDKRGLSEENGNQITPDRQSTWPLALPLSQ